MQLKRKEHFDAVQGLFRQQHARTAHFLRHILLFGQAVFHGQHRLLIIDMEGRFELHGRNDGGIDIGQFPARMIGEEMPAAGLAPLSQAPAGPVVDPDIGRSLDDFDGIGRPERKGDHPGPADHSRQELQWQ